MGGGKQLSGRLASDFMEERKTVTWGREGEDKFVAGRGSVALHGGATREKPIIFLWYRRDAGGVNGKGRKGGKAVWSPGRTLLLRRTGS